MVAVTFFIIMLVVVFYKIYEKQQDEAFKAQYELQKQNEVLRVQLMTEKELLDYVKYINQNNTYTTGFINYAGIKEAQRILARKGHEITVYENKPYVKEKSSFFKPKY